MKEKGGSEKCFDCKHIYNINLTIPYLNVTGGVLRKQWIRSQ